MVKYIILLPLIALFAYLGVIGLGKNVVIAILFFILSACFFIAFVCFLVAQLYNINVGKKGKEVEADIIGYYDAFAGQYERHEVEEPKERGGYFLLLKYVDEKGIEQQVKTDKVIPGKEAVKLKEKGKITIRCKGASIYIVKEK